MAWSCTVSGELATAAVPDSAQAWAAEGHDGFARMWAQGMQGPLDDIAYLDQQRSDWEGTCSP